jgi:hypothetical protein
MAWMRYPKTMQEKRQWFADFGRGIKMRLRRNPKLLADAWDDATTVKQRSWKVQRKSRWRRTFEK